MIILTDPEGNQIERKSITDVANHLGRNYKAVHDSVYKGYFVRHRETKIEYKAHEAPRTI
jgi:hypothetical protein